MPPTSPPTSSPPEPSPPCPVCGNTETALLAVAVFVTAHHCPLCDELFHVRAEFHPKGAAIERMGKRHAAVASFPA